MLQFICVQITYIFVTEEGCAHQTVKHSTLIQVQSI